jgi:hypothetical protein
VCNDFDQFLNEREAQQNGQRTAEGIVAHGASTEWQRLKDATKSLTAGKAIDGNLFQWSPYTSHYSDFLQLKNVAALFFDKVARDPIPQL